jgi:hypothetical protein
MDAMARRRKPPQEGDPPVYARGMQPLCVNVPCNHSISLHGGAKDPKGCTALGCHCEAWVGSIQPRAATA